ncbi:MAG: NAD(P)-dependent oxidoreductase [Gammaproteobacteria bacterium]|nr:NAD(P)-dependent oxidoreductase [Gammaproteobacteria bacterium]NVK87444.1 NAD(P)-dependent oxidoreductase [Gammaproteobacteria bacterium]
MEFSNRTAFITGASRGIGRAIALKLSALGANVVIAAKSAKPHPKLPGTIFSVAEEIQQQGGQALALELDVRKEIAVKIALEQAAQHFGGIDIIINNAGAISLTGVEQTSPKRYDLMHSVNHRAVYTLAHYGLPYLKQSSHAHILSLSPPLNFADQWVKDYAPYTLSKYGMTILSQGMALEFAQYQIAVNTLWPKTMIATAAIEHAVGNEAMLQHCRTPDIMADAAAAILSDQAIAGSGLSLIDEDVLRLQGIEDFAKYAVNPQQPLFDDLFI